MLRDGLPLDDVADRLGRRADGVASRCRMMLPAGAGVRRADADLELRMHLAADPDYDWRAGLREEARRRGGIHWDLALDGILLQGWERARPLHDLVADTGAAELGVAARLVELGLAESRVGVAGRLGCTPGGTLEVHVRMAADRAAAAVWVLLADGVRGTERVPPRGEDAPTTYRHVSLHGDREQAEQTLDRLMAGHAALGGTDAGVAVTLARRTVGEQAIGETHHGLGGG